MMRLNPDLVNDDLVRKLQGLDGQTPNRARHSVLDGLRQDAQAELLVPKGLEGCLAQCWHQVFLAEFLSAEKATLRKLLADACRISPLVAPESAARPAELQLLGHLRELQEIDRHRAGASLFLGRVQDYSDVVADVIHFRVEELENWLEDWWAAPPSSAIKTTLMEANLSQADAAIYGRPMEAALDAVDDLRKPLVFGLAHPKCFSTTEHPAPKGLASGAPTGSSAQPSFPPMQSAEIQITATAARSTPAVLDRQRLRDRRAAEKAARQLPPTVGRFSLPLPGATSQASGGLQTAPGSAIGAPAPAEWTSGGSTDVPPAVLRDPWQETMPEELEIESSARLDRLADQQTSTPPGAEQPGRGKAASSVGLTTIPEAEVIGGSLGPTTAPVPPAPTVMGAARAPPAGCGPPAPPVRNPPCSREEMERHARIPAQVIEAKAAPPQPPPLMARPQQESLALVPSVPPALPAAGRPVPSLTWARLRQHADGSVVGGMLDIAEIWRAAYERGLAVNVGNMPPISVIGQGLSVVLAANYAGTKAPPPRRLDPPVSAAMYSAVWLPMDQRSMRPHPEEHSVCGPQTAEDLLPCEPYPLTDSLDGRVPVRPDFYEVIDQSLFRHAGRDVDPQPPADPARLEVNVDSLPAVAQADLLSDDPLIRMRVLEVSPVDAAVWTAAQVLRLRPGTDLSWDAWRERRMQAWEEAAGPEMFLQGAVRWTWGPTVRGVEDFSTWITTGPGAARDRPTSSMSRALVAGTSHTMKLMLQNARSQDPVEYFSMPAGQAFGWMGLEDFGLRPLARPQDLWAFACVCPSPAELGVLCAVEAVRFRRLGESVLQAVPSPETMVAACFVPGFAAPANFRPASTVLLQTRMAPYAQPAPTEGDCVTGVSGFMSVNVLRTVRVAPDALQNCGSALEQSFLPGPFFVQHAGQAGPELVRRGPWWIHNALIGLAERNGLIFLVLPPLATQGSPRVAGPTGTSLTVFADLPAPFISAVPLLQLHQGTETTEILQQVWPSMQEALWAVMQDRSSRQWSYLEGHVDADQARDLWDRHGRLHRTRPLMSKVVLEVSILLTGSELEHVISIAPSAFRVRIESLAERLQTVLRPWRISATPVLPTFHVC